jgi:hypothetical protein
MRENLSRWIADTCSSLERRHWAALVVALVGTHALDVLVTLRSWTLETHPVATALGPQAWVVAHVVAVAIVLAAAWAVRALGSDDDHDDALAVGLVGIGLVAGLAGPTGNLIVLHGAPSAAWALWGLVGVGTATLATGGWMPDAPARPTRGQVGSVALALAVLASVPAGLLAPSTTVIADPADEEWSVATGSRVVSSPTVSNGTVYVGSDDSSIYALDASTGDEEWSVSTGGFVQSSPTVSNGTVYVGSNDNSIYALDASTGDEEWSVSTGGFVQSSPTVADGTVYVGSQNNSLNTNNP